MGTFGPTALNFGYNIFLLSLFRGSLYFNGNLYVSLFADKSRNNFCFFITKRYSSSGEYWWNIWSWPSMNINIETLCLSPHSFPEILTFLAMQDLYWQIFWACKLVGIEKNGVWWISIISKFTASHESCQSVAIRMIASTQTHWSHCTTAMNGLCTYIPFIIFVSAKILFIIQKNAKA